MLITELLVIIISWINFNPILGYVMRWRGERRGQRRAREKAKEKEWVWVVLLQTPGI